MTDQDIALGTRWHVDSRASNVYEVTAIRDCNGWPYYDLTLVEVHEHGYRLGSVIGVERAWFDRRGIPAR